MTNRPLRLLPVWIVIAILAAIALSGCSASIGAKAEPSPLYQYNVPTAPDGYAPYWYDRPPAAPHTPAPPY